MAPEELEGRVEDLETMIAHQARVIEELSDEIASVNRRLDGMTTTIRTLAERLQTVEDVATPTPEARKPPHY